MEPSSCLGTGWLSSRLAQSVVRHVRAISKALRSDTTDVRVAAVMWLTDVDVAIGGGIGKHRFLHSDRADTNYRPSKVDRVGQLVVDDTVC